MVFCNFRSRAIAKQTRILPAAVTRMTRRRKVQSMMMMMIKLCCLLMARFQLLYFRSFRSSILKMKIMSVCRWLIQLNLPDPHHFSEHISLSIVSFNLFDLDHLIEKSEQRDREREKKTSRTSYTY